MKDVYHEGNGCRHFSCFSVQEIGFVPVLPDSVEDACSQEQGASDDRGIKDVAVSAQLKRYDYGA